MGFSQFENRSGKADMARESRELREKIEWLRRETGRHLLKARPDTKLEMTVAKQLVVHDAPSTIYDELAIRI
jgi:hypothetical protein